MTLDLTVAICTAGRPALLADLLASLAAADVDRRAREVVVVDNDRRGSAAEVVAAAGIAVLRRVHLPEPNIAAARNRALAEARGELVLFVDDDQLVAPDVFAALARAWAARPAWADGLRPRVVRRWERDPDHPDHDDRGARWGPPPGTSIEGREVDRPSFSTNGLLVRRAALAGLARAAWGGPFDPFFGLRGGSDTELFVRATEAGLRFAEAASVTITERMPPARATPTWALRSAFRIGFGNALIDLRRGLRADVLREAAAPLARLAATAPLWAARPRRWPSRLRALSFVAGKLWALAGGDFEHYRPDGLTWVVFGDDWGRHPSTTQHLVSHLPREDRVLWIGSLGMREPRLRAADLRRIAGRLRPSPARADDPSPNAIDTADATRRPTRILRPPVLPWHRNTLVAAVNRAALRALLAGIRRPVVLASNPVAALYLDVVDPARVIYLKLDRYEDVPGVDHALVAHVEPAMLARADVVFAPNAAILDGVAHRDARVLPQGVDLAAFAAIPAEPPPTRVCGYWGWIGDWLDEDLVVAVARARPDWTFELRGPARITLARASREPNVSLLPAVPHAALAAAAAHWRAAWAPFRDAHHITSASPLKLREYLAAGFPTAATPFAEARALPEIALVRDPAEAGRFLDGALADTAAARARRRASVAADGWAARAAVLRAAAEASVYTPGEQ